MYPVSRNIPCSTCGFPQNYCPGHLGKIELYKPVLNIWFHKYIISILESICYKCGTLLANRETVARISPGKSERLKKIADMSRELTCRNKNCANYEQKNPKYMKKNKDSMVKLHYKLATVREGFITSSEIVTLFNMIPEDDLEAVGG